MISPSGQGTGTGRRAGESGGLALYKDLRFGEAGLQQAATIDYFATSLPNLLVFEEDLQARFSASPPPPGRA